MKRTTLIATLVINHLKIKSPRKGSRKGIKQNHPGLEYFLATGSAAFFVECQCKTPVVVFLRPVETAGCQLWKPRWRLIPPRRAEVLFTSWEYPDAVMTPVPYC